MPTANNLSLGNSSNGNNSGHISLLNMFLDFCQLIFNYRSDIESKKDETTPELINQNLSAVIRNYMEQERTVIINKDMNDIIYLMAAMADEIFLNMNWNGKKFWEENMLEAKFFESQIAGEYIFRKIDELLKQNEGFSVEKAEIYLKAFALGFRGKFRDQKDENLKISEYCKNLVQFMEQKDLSLRTHDLRLFEKQYTYTIPTITRKLLPDASIINYVVAFYTFMFVIITSFIWIVETQSIDKLLYEITYIAMRSHS